MAQRSTTERQLESEPLEAKWNTIPELLAYAAGQFRDRDALIDGNTSWSYGELESHVHAVARALIAGGVQPGERIAIWAPNIPEWVVVALGVYAVGGVLVPINTRFKGTEATYVIQKAGVSRIFTVTDFLDTDYVELLSEDVRSALDIVVLRGPVPSDATSFEQFVASGVGLDDAQRIERASAVEPNDVCHVLFTSGTTGAPKGVVLEHGQICRAYLVFAEVIDLREGDRYLVVNPFFHSFGLHAGILCCLMTGATIIPLATFEPSDAMRLIADQRVTVFPGPPTVYQTMLNHPEFAAHDLQSLRVAILGATTIPVALVEDLRTRLGMETVVTGFGITEASGIVTMCRFDDPPEVVATTTGRPLPGVAIRIVDEDGTDRPPGEPGELLVAGYNVMREYLDDAAETSIALDAEGWLHTGDIGHVRSDGNLVITDRKKDMFIVGGFNAYPAEIEQLMLRHPDIAQVAVVGVPDERLGEVGYAFVIPRQGAATDDDAILDWCHDNFANFKAPRYVEFVSSFPLNATGKVLKYELRETATQQLADSPQSPERNESTSQ
jgi:acyl-CoA synthetase (AMP-forming)/AMP-acid ligase II